MYMTSLLVCCGDPLHFKPCANLRICPITHLPEHADSFTDSAFLARRFHFMGASSTGSDLPPLTALRDFAPSSRQHGADSHLMLVARHCRRCPKRRITRNKRIPDTVRTIYADTHRRCSAPFEGTP